MTLTSKLDAILAQCREVLGEENKCRTLVFSNQYDGLPYYGLSQQNEIVLTSKSEQEMRYTIRARTLTPRLARATITAIEMLRLVDIYDASPRQSGARNTLQRIADEWEVSP